MALFDKDDDGKLSLTELEASPGLLAGIKTYDKDGDEMISKAEIAARLQKFVVRGIALSRLSATVKLDGRPLAGATIRFFLSPTLVRRRSLPVERR